MLMVKDEEFNTILHEIDYPISCDMIIPYTIWIKYNWESLKVKFQGILIEQDEKKREKRENMCTQSN